MASNGAHAACELDGSLDGSQPQCREKFWIVSPKILPLPTMVITSSGVIRVVPNKPSSCTVPTTPPTLTKSPTLIGRRIA